MAICLTCGETMTKCVCTDVFVEDVKLIEAYRENELEMFIEKPIREIRYN